MRSREDIEKLTQEEGINTAYNSRVIIELLLDIRDLLEKATKPIELPENFNGIIGHKVLNTPTEKPEDQTTWINDPLPTKD